MIELIENLQQLVRDGDLLDAAEEVQRKEVACSEVDALEADASEATEGEKNHKKGGLNCVFKNFSFLRSEKLFPYLQSEIVQSLTRVQSLSAAD